MLQTIIGIIAMVIGILMVIYSRWFLEFIGPIEWAERKIHPEGGSRLAYKLIGFLVFLVGFLIMTGWIKSIIFLFFPGL